MVKLWHFYPRTLEIARFLDIQEFTEVGKQLQPSVFRFSNGMSMSREFHVHASFICRSSIKDKNAEQALKGEFSTVQEKSTCPGAVHP